MEIINIPLELLIQPIAYLQTVYLNKTTAEKELAALNLLQLQYFVCFTVIRVTSYCLLS